MSQAVRVKRANFFSERSFPQLERALGYRFGWKVGREHGMAKAGRALLRNVMRASALEAVRYAREDARKAAA